MNEDPTIDVWLCWNDFPFSKSAEEVAWLNFSYVGPEIESGWSLIKRKKRRESQSPGLAWLLIFEACRIRGQCECHICRLNCVTHCASRLWVWHLTSWHSVTMSHIVPPHWSISIPWARAQKQTFIQSCTLLRSHDPVKPKTLISGTNDLVFSFSLISLFDCPISEVMTMWQPSWLPNTIRWMSRRLFDLLDTGLAPVWSVIQSARNLG